MTLPPSSSAALVVDSTVRGGKERSTGRIEVVGVLMMGEQHDIDPVLLGDVECWARQLC
jgi:hypothetical protein